MRTEWLAREAHTCRKRAEEYAGRPEQPFLLSLANAFDELVICRSADMRSDSKVR